VIRHLPGGGDSGSAGRKASKTWADYSNATPRKSQVHCLPWTPLGGGGEQRAHLQECGRRLKREKARPEGEKTGGRTLQDDRRHHRSVLRRPLRNGGEYAGLKILEKTSSTMISIWPQKEIVQPPGLVQLTEKTVITKDSFGWGKSPRCTRPQRKRERHI